MNKSLRYNYRNSIYFDHYEPEIVADIEKGREYEYLLTYTLFLRYRLFSFLELELKEQVVLSTELVHYDSDPHRVSQQLEADRSEECTSELHIRSHLVCGLLIE